MKLTTQQKKVITEMRRHSVIGFIRSFAEKEEMMKKNIERAKRAKRDSRLVNFY